MAGAELPLPVVQAGFLQRIVKLRPHVRIGQIGVLPGRSGDQTGGVVDADQRAGINQVDRAIMHDGVRTFGDHIVPREFRHNDLLRLAGKPFRTGRIEAGDPDAADLLPCVIPAAGIVEDGHVERNTLNRIEHTAGRREDWLGNRPVFRFARVEIRTVGMLLELHDMAAARPHVWLASTIVERAVRIGRHAVEAWHEQHRQFPVDHMQFRSPEAAGHGASFSVVITAFEQIDFLGTAARRVGKCFDGVGDAQRHVRGAIVRIDAVAVGIVGGDEHEHRLAVETPSKHRRIGTFHSKRHRIYGLTDTAIHRVLPTRLEVAFGGLLCDCFKFGFIPIHSAGGIRSVAIGEFGAGCPERQHRFTSPFTVERRIDMLRLHRCSNVVDTAEAFDEFCGLFFGNRKHIARNGIGNAIITRRVPLSRCRIFRLLGVRNIDWFAGLGSSHNIGNSCNMGFAVV